jgi:hypothetical protein
MTKSLWAAGLCLALASAVHAQPAPPEIPFDSVPDFFKLPDNMYFGEVAGIAVNSQKHVYVLSRGNTNGPAYGAAATQLLEFDQDGKFVREIGRNLYAWSFAHTVRIDRHDDIWVADKGSDVVVRFDPAGRVKMVFGRKAEASDENAHPLAHPTPPLPRSTRKTTSISATATSIRALRNTTRTATGLRRTAHRARARDNSTRCTRW